MTNKERNLIKKKILKCLTEDFKNNQALFDKKEGQQVFNGTDLNMVMDKVVKGLEMAKHELNAVERTKAINENEDEKEFCVCCTCNITKGIEGQNNYCSMCDHYF
jgi:NADH pyrophosphatase NudC (nudix superfamily)